MRISRLQNVREVAARGYTARALALSAEAPTNDVANSPPPMPVPVTIPATMPPVDTSKEIESVAASTNSEDNLRRVPTGPSHSCTLKSCWLDTSFQLLFAATNQNFAQFSLLCQPLPEDSGLKALYTALYERKLVDSTGNTTSIALERQRDSLRELLRARGLFRETDCFEPFCGWLAELVRLESVSDSPRIATYFEVLLVEVHSCSGSPITNPPIRRRVNQLSEEHHKQYHGCFSEYFADLTSSEIDLLPSSSCGRSHETTVLCPRRHEDIRTLLVSLPVLLVVEVADELGRGQAYDPLKWDFPPTVSPTRSSSDEDSCIYDLVGLATVDASGSHFIAVYPSDDRTRIYTCDDDKDCRIPARQATRADVNGVAVASGIEIQPGFKVCAAFYHLRGGIEAQEKFYESRTSYYSHRYNLEFSESALAHGQPCSSSYLSPDLDVFDQCFWTSTRAEEYWVGSPPKNIPLELQALQPERVEERNLFDTDSSFFTDSANWFNPLISLQCRCGKVGKGGILFRPEDGPTIQCKKCRTRSHIACQRIGKVAEQVPFICDSCDPQTPLIRNANERVDRLRPGCGAFARAGDHWYPVRIIQRANETSWWVRWWRECFMERDDVRPGRISIVNTWDIFQFDSLWQDSQTRQPIQLGYWIPARETPAITVLNNPFAVHHTDDAITALSNSVELIRELVFRPETVPNTLVPAKAWLEANQENLTEAFILYCGGLSVVDRAQTADWFATRISVCKTGRFRWYGSLAHAHALTTVLAYRIRCATPPQVTESFILQKAWEIQMMGLPTPWMEADVDKECIEFLEIDQLQHCTLGSAGCRSRAH